MQDSNLNQVVQGHLERARIEVGSFEQMRAPSIGDRIAAINESLVIIAALADAPVRNVSMQERDEAVAIIVKQAEAAKQEIFWMLEALPNSAAITPAPTQDQREAAER